MWDDDEVLAELIELNRNTHGETLTKKQYEEHGEYHPNTIQRRWGTWKEAKRRAGICAEQQNPNIKREELLQDVKRVKEEHGLDAESYRKHGEHALMTLYNRFGSLKKVRQQV